MPKFHILNHELYNSKVRFLISLDALETGTYQYHFDSFGTRIIHPWWNAYLQRPSIREFISEEQRHPHRGNEVMIKERLPPSFIQGLVVPDPETYDALLVHLRSRGLVQQETIFGIPVEQFIHIGTRVQDVLGRGRELA